MSRSFWPVHEAAQADYEALREAVLAGERPHSLSAIRFARRGLAGLIAWPTAEPVFTAMILGARRPPWTPRRDPRVDALAAGYEVILNAHRALAGSERAQQ